MRRAVQKCQSIDQSINSHEAVSKNSNGVHCMFELIIGGSCCGGGVVAVVADGVDFASFDGDEDVPAVVEVGVDILNSNLQLIFKQGSLFES